LVEYTLINRDMELFLQVLSSLVTTAFIFCLTWVGRRIPLWGRLVARPLRQLACRRIQGSEQQEAADFAHANLTSMQRAYLMLILDERFVELLCGRDVLEFLSFQRHLIILLALIASVALVVVMPVHAIGGVRDDLYRFQSTSIRNLPGDSIGHWVNVVVSAIYLPIAVLIMRRFVHALYGRRRGGGKLSLAPSAVHRMTNVSRSLVLYGLPAGLRKAPALLEWFEKNYPGFGVEAVNVCVKWTAVHSLRITKHYYRTVLDECEKSGCHCQWENFIWRLRYFGILCGCWRKNVLARKFYQAKFDEAEESLRRELRTIAAGHHILDTAFVTFRTLSEAVAVVDYQNYRRNADTSFSVAFAKPAKTIRWRNIIRFRYFALVNVGHVAFLMAVVLVFSSPESVSSILAPVAQQFRGFHLENYELFASWFTNSFYESLWFVGSGNLVPLLVLRSTEYLGKNTYYLQASSKIPHTVHPYNCTVHLMVA
jgi:hypothetical protein